METKHEKESRIRLELSSLIALLCMRLGLATSDDQSLSEMLQACDKRLAEVKFEPGASMTSIKTDSAQNIRVQMPTGRSKKIEESSSSEDEALFKRGRRPSQR